MLFVLSNKSNILFEINSNIYKFNNAAPKYSVELIIDASLYHK